MITRTKIKPEESARALDNGLSPLPNGDSEIKRKIRARQSTIWIEHGRASVRRACDGGLIVTRHLTHLTFLPQRVWEKKPRKKPHIFNRGFKGMHKGLTE